MSMQEKELSHGICIYASVYNRVLLLYPDLLRIYSVNLWGDEHFQFMRWSPRKWSSVHLSPITVHNMITYTLFFQSICWWENWLTILCEHLLNIRSSPNACLQRLSIWASQAKRQSKALKPFFLHTRQSYPLHSMEESLLHLHLLTFKLWSLRGPSPLCLCWVRVDYFWKVHKRAPPNIGKAKYQHNVSSKVHMHIMCWHVVQFQNTRGAH